MKSQKSESIFITESTFSDSSYHRSATNGSFFLGELMHAMSRGMQVPLTDPRRSQVSC